MSTPMASLISNICSLILLALFPMGMATATEFRIATAEQLDTPIGQAVVNFVDKVQRADRGLSLNYFPGLGSASEIRRMLEKRSIDIAVVPFDSIPVLAGSPLSNPFFAKNSKEVRQALGSEVGAFAKSDLAQKNFLTMDFWHVSSELFGSKAPILNVRSLQGAKVLATSNRINETLSALGATTVNVAFGELYAALNAGIADGANVGVNPKTPSSQFNEVLTHYVDREFKPSLYAVLVNKDQWPEIDYPTQYLFAREAESVGEELVRVVEADEKSFKQQRISRGASFYEWNEVLTN